MNMLRGAALGLTLALVFAVRAEAGPIIGGNSCDDRGPVILTLDGDNRCDNGGPILTPIGRDDSTSCDTNDSRCLPAPCLPVVCPPVTCLPVTCIPAPRECVPVCQQPPCETPPGVPEPATMTLVVAGLAALGSRLRRSMR
ncbi:MAG TPA: PEP-CTERM sorting domain-containing protein [Planctomycetota bacterium]|nr:PEP-CTERM sorting domain-containing protein [Planctomycetota bacterium]